MGSTQSRFILRPLGILYRYLKILNIHIFLKKLTYKVHLVFLILICHLTQEVIYLNV